MQYGDNISVIWNEEAVFVDNVWTPGAPKSFESNCRHEMESGVKKNPGKDGVVFEYTMVIYAPKMSVIIPENANYTLTCANGRIIKGIVKGSDTSSFNSRIWV